MNLFGFQLPAHQVRRVHPAPWDPRVARVRGASRVLLALPATRGFPPGPHRPTQAPTEPPEPRGPPDSLVQPESEACPVFWAPLGTLALPDNLEWGLEDHLALLVCLGQVTLILTVLFAWFVKSNSHGLYRAMRKTGRQFQASRRPDC